LKNRNDWPEKFAAAIKQDVSHHFYPFASLNKFNKKKLSLQKTTQHINFNFENINNAVLTTIFCLVVLKVQCNSSWWGFGTWNGNILF
jgi:hypothetical protein